MSEINPWLTGDQVRNPGCMKCSVTDRLETIRWSTDLAWLRTVVAYRDNQLTVRKAAERRMRTLAKRSL